MEQKIKQLKVQIVRHHDDAPNRKLRKQERFRKLSVKISNKLGTSGAFFVAVFFILLWAVSGPLFNFSDTWQLVINTGTTVVTFLMVFVIQNTQNRDSRAMHLKLDELIKSHKGARTEFVEIEDLSDVEIEELQGQFRALNEKFTKNKK